MAGSREQGTAILPGVRIPFREFAGALRDFTATDLGVIAAQTGSEQVTIPAVDMDRVIFCNAIQTSFDAIPRARYD